MAGQDIIDLLNSLTASEQDAVREFIQFLKERGQTPASPFIAAVDEFIEQHPELLRRLAR